MSISTESRIYGCWLGKSIGGTLGLPAEGLTQRLHYTFYDPIPTVAPPNDDLELQLVWLHLLETQGFDLTQRDMAEAWLAHIHYMWDEYGRTRWNLRRGVPARDAGTFENPFVSGMGSPIRSEIWAIVAGGNSQTAALYGELDASLDHGIEGIMGEVFFCVLQTLALRGIALNDSLHQARAVLTAASETAAAIDLIFELHTRKVEAWQAREELLTKHNSENFTHSPLNVALTVWALLYGNGDFGDSILLAVNGGYDTDCTAATVGATLGLVFGSEGIPPRWSAPIGEGVFVGPGIIDANAPTTLSELSNRTLTLMNQLASRPTPPRIEIEAPGNALDLTQLPGTIEITPLDGSPPLLWANGELPTAVKRAGGATWIWTTGAFKHQTLNIMALADAGARLFVDDELMVSCPHALPYVPAPHRTPSGSQVQFQPTRESHKVRLELNSCDENTRASAVLSTSNYHLAPWNGEMLPFEPQLD